VESAIPEDDLFAGIRDLARSGGEDRRSGRER